MILEDKKGVSLLITQIKKRDGEIVNYDASKIVHAIQKASNEVEADIGAIIVSNILDDIETELSKKEEIATVECIQDLVEEALLANGYITTARAYIQYRERQKQERKRDLFKKRIQMKPYEYPEFMEFGDAIRHSYWVHTEFNFTSDIQDFHTKVKPHERTAVQNSMLAIAQVEVAVKTFWGDLYHRMPKYELGAVGAVFSESEARHAEAYSHLLEVLGLNSQFDRIQDIPALRERVDYLTKATSWAKTGDDKDYVLSMILFSLFIEHVSLFSQFLVMMSFNKHKNVFSGLSNVIEATSKEEQIHGLFGIDIVNTLREERPEWFDSVMEETVYKPCDDSYEAEKKVVDWIFEDGELDFMSKQTVLEFIKNRLNNSLESIGYDKIFDVDAKLVRETSWFDDEIVGTKLTDFLNTRSINYTKFTQSITGETLFSPLSEIEREGASTKEKVNQILRMRMMEL